MWPLQRRHRQAANLLTIAVGPKAFVAYYVRGCLHPAHRGYDTRMTLRLLAVGSEAQRRVALCARR